MIRHIALELSTASGSPFPGWVRLSNHHHVSSPLSVRTSPPRIAKGQLAEMHIGPIVIENNDHNSSNIKVAWTRKWARPCLDPCYKSWYVRTVAKKYTTLDHTACVSEWSTELGSTPLPVGSNSLDLPKQQPNDITGMGGVPGRETGHPFSI